MNSQVLILSKPTFFNHKNEMRMILIICPGMELSIKGKNVGILFIAPKRSFWVPCLHTSSAPGSLPSVPIPEALLCCLWVSSPVVTGTPDSLASSKRFLLGCPCHASQAHALLLWILPRVPSTLSFPRPLNVYLLQHSVSIFVQLSYQFG